ncbi:MAG: hypothetical protein ACOX6D_06130 [Thermoguttaceae bacterium]|jgi:hypothetical protein
MPRSFHRTIFSIWGWVLSALSILLCTCGCHPIPRAYCGREVVETCPVEGQSSLRQWYTPPRPESGETLQSRRENTPPGHIQSVGFTQKNFGDMEQTGPNPAHSLGKVEWADTQRSVTEAAEPEFSERAVPRVQDLATLADSVPGMLPFDTPVPDLNPADFIDELPDFVTITESNRQSRPIKAALAESIENPQYLNNAEISFLPDTKKKTSAMSGDETSRDWRELTQQAIALLRNEIDRRVETGEICPAEEARLRLLLLTTGNIPGAAEKIAGMDPNLQTFWERECRGLGRFIETQEDSSDDVRNTAWMEAVPDLREGLMALRSGMPLKIRKSLFVKEPSAFGFYEEVSPSFTPGETINVYFELDNIVCRESDEKSRFDIAVLCRRELTDSLNRAVVDTKEKLCAGHSASPLNDVVLNLSIRLPEGLAPGTYTIKTVLMDRQSPVREPVTHVMEFRVD